MELVASPQDLIALRDYAYLGSEEDIKFVKGIYRQLAFDQFADALMDGLDLVIDLASVGAEVVDAIVPL
jgi:hypothetical protein